MPSDSFLCFTQTIAFWLSWYMSPHWVAIVIIYLPAKESTIESHPSRCSTRHGASGFISSDPTNVSIDSLSCFHVRVLGEEHLIFEWIWTHSHNSFSPVCLSIPLCMHSHADLLLRWSLVCFTFTSGRDHVTPSQILLTVSGLPMIG